MLDSHGIKHKWEPSERLNKLAGKRTLHLSPEFDRGLFDLLEERKSRFSSESEYNRIRNALKRAMREAPFWGQAYELPPNITAHQFMTMLEHTKTVGKFIFWGSEYPKALPRMRHIGVTAIVALRAALLD